MGCGGSKEQDVQLAAAPEAAPENVTLKEAAGVNNKLGKQFGGLIGKYTQRGCGKPLEFDLDVLGIIAGVVQTNL